MQQRAVLRLRMERTTKGRAPAGAPDRPLASSARFAAGFYRPEELPESAGARVRALLFNAAMRPGTPWVRRVDEKSARLAASSLMVPLRYTSPICGPPLALTIKSLRVTVSPLALTICVLTMVP